MYDAIKKNPFSNVQQADELADCRLPAAHNRFSSLELIFNSLHPRDISGKG